MNLDISVVNADFKNFINKITSYNWYILQIKKAHSLQESYYGPSLNSYHSHNPASLL